MRIRVLGPLSIESERGVVSIAGAKERTVLALLVARWGAVVPTESLIDELWGDDPPATAAKSLQAHVVRLRDALEPSRPRGRSGSYVQTRGSAYELTIDREAIDALQFERLAADGRRALGAGAIESAIQLLRAADGLWRGPAYSDFEAPALRDERQRLGELRRAALQDRIESELVAGHHQGLVAELEARVGADPTDEWGWARLMLALYRGGRQADALAAYPRARRALADEAGVEPGPELVELQRRILAQDSGLLDRLGSATRGLPAPLAVPPGRLVGRGPLVADLVRWWETRPELGPGVVWIGGGAGSGRTRLAAELAGQIEGTAAILYSSAEPPSSEPLAVMLRLASQLGRDIGRDGDLASETVGSRLGATLAHLTSNDRLLLVIDDLEAPDDRLGAALRAMLDELAGRWVLILLLGPTLDPANHLRKLGRQFLGSIDMPLLRPEEVAAIAAEYLGDEEAGLAAADIWPRSGGLPGRVHEAILDFARRQVSRRVEAAASQVATDRSALRTTRAALAAGIERWQGLARRGPRGSVVEGPARAPYKGLARFEVDDAAVFFGRETLIRELVTRVAEQSVVAIVGPSGSGKSSLARAGVLAALQSGILPGSEHWPTAIVVPGARPRRQLDEAGLHHSSGRTVVLVDQLEQLFANCTDPAERRAFLDHLAGLASPSHPGDNRGPGSPLVVVALRADHFGHVIEAPAFAALLADATVTVGPMTPDEVERAIELPAQRSGLRLEPGLAAAIAADVAGRPGALPLLSTAMLELWERRRGGTMTWSGYREAGGVRGALARLAEDAYGRLDPADRGVARRILQRTARVASGTEDEVARRVPLGELESEGPAGRRVLVALSERRLVTIDSGAVEVAHEALFREWPRLRAWLAEDRLGRELHGHLISAAREWADRGRHPGELYRGPRLSAATEWSREHADELNDLEREFLAGSVAEHERETREAEDRLVTSVRANRRLRLAATGLAAALVLALVAGGLAASQSDLAARRATAANAARLSAIALAETGSDRALLLAVQAYQLDVSVETRSALLALLAGGPDLVGILHGDPGERFIDVALTGDGRRVALAANSGQIHVFDTGTRTRIATLRVPGENSFHIGIDAAGDHVLAVGEVGRRLFRWNVTTGELVSNLELGVVAGEGSMAAIAIRRDAAEVVAGTTGGVRFHSTMGAGTVEQLGIDGRPGPIAITDDGLRIAVAVGPVVIVLARDGREIGRIDVGVEPDRLALSTDGSRLGIALVDGSAVAVGIPSMEQLRASLHRDAAKDLAFTADGQAIVSVSEDGSVVAWDLRSGDIRQYRPGHAGRVFAVALSSDGRAAVTASTDGTGGLWDLTARTGFGSQVGQVPADAVRAASSPDGIRVVAAYPDGRIAATTLDSGIDWLRQSGLGEISALAWSADGSLLAIGNLDGEAAILDAGTGARIVGPVSVRRAPIAGIAFSPDGATIAAATLDGLAILDRALEPQAADPWHGTRALAVAFDPGGTRLGASSEGGRLRTWTWPGLTIEAEATGASAAETLAFAADGSQLVTGSSDGSAQVWASATLAAGPGPLRGHPNFVLGAGFSPDGRSIVSSGLDGTAVVWDVASGRQIGRPLLGPGEGGSMAWFAGSRVVSIRLGSGLIWSWDLDPERAVRLACSIAGRQLTSDEWARYLPGEPYAPAC